jgi:hypothetical protein
MQTESFDQTIPGLGCSASEPAIRGIDAHGRISGDKNLEVIKIKLPWSALLPSWVSHQKLEKFE